jgi:hypothetical protein
MPPQHIGIVALSAAGAALCYRTISWKAPICLGRTIIRKSRCTPILSRSNVKCICANDWAGVAEPTLSSSQKPWKTEGLMEDRGLACAGERGLGVS